MYLLQVQSPSWYQNKSVETSRMCGSREYPYPPHGRFFHLNPHFLEEFSVQLDTFPYKFWLLRPPSPSEFPMTIHWGRYGYFGSMCVSGKLPTYPSPNLTLTLLTLGKMLGLGRGRRAVSHKHTLIRYFLEPHNVKRLFNAKGSVAALTRSHTSGSLPFKIIKEQTTVSMLLSPQNNLQQHQHQRTIRVTQRILHSGVGIRILSSSAVSISHE